MPAVEYEDVLDQAMEQMKLGISAANASRRWYMLLMLLVFLVFVETIRIECAYEVPCCTVLVNLFSFTLSQFAEIYF